MSNNFISVTGFCSSLTKYMSLEHPPDISIYFLIPSYPSPPPVRPRWRWCMPAVRTRWYERPRWLGFWRSHHLFSSFSSYFSHHIISSFSFSYFLTSFSSYLIAFPWIPFLLRLAPQYPSTLITFPLNPPNFSCCKPIDLVPPKNTQWQPAPQWQRVVSIELDG